MNRARTGMSGTVAVSKKTGSARLICLAIALSFQEIRAECDKHETVDEPHCVGR